jgi:hypothetical protein
VVREETIEPPAELAAATARHAMELHGEQRHDHPGRDIDEHDARRHGPQVDLRERHRARHEQRRPQQPGAEPHPVEGACFPGLQQREIALDHEHRARKVDAHDEQQLDHAHDDAAHAEQVQRDSRDHGARRAEMSDPEAREHAHEPAAENDVDERADEDGQQPPPRLARLGVGHEREIDRGQSIQAAVEIPPGSFQVIEFHGDSPRRRAAAP